MLDVHALTVTPGAALVLGNPGAIAGGNDGQTSAGVPITGGAHLKMWGMLSPTADTIANVKLTSQDMVDPINGITFTPGAASLLNCVFDYTELAYKTGARVLTAGTNTGVVAGAGILIDEYASGPCVKGNYDMGGEVRTGANTFGGALTANTWGSLVYAPTQALPTGKYAILGAFVSAITNAAAIRFSHADFGQFRPGFIVHNYETISTATWDKMFKDDLVMTAAGEQFIYLSEKLGRPMCPVFTNGPNGTGLVMEMISAQADTPVVNLVLAQISKG
jgi:hypothetical protein